MRLSPSSWLLRACPPPRMLPRSCCLWCRCWPSMRGRFGLRRSPCRGARMAASGMTGIILAWGRSRRMGQPKALMPWGRGPLIDAVIAALGPIVDELLIVAKDAGPFVDRGVRVVTDLMAEGHPWVGLYTGLRSATYDVSFVCACDMPWLNPALIRYLRDVRDDFEAVRSEERR